jgi:hypothetical protein
MSTKKAKTDTEFFSQKCSQKGNLYLRPTPAPVFTALKTYIDSCVHSNVVHAVPRANLYQGIFNQYVRHSLKSPTHYDQNVVFSISLLIYITLIYEFIMRMQLKAVENEKRL